IMAWLAGPRFHWSLARFIHGAALLAVVAAVSLILFTGVLPRSAAEHPFELAVFPCIIWSALTFGVRGTTAITLVVAGISIYGTTPHLGPFTSSATQATPHMNLILLLLFLAVVAVTGLFLGTAITARELADARRAVDTSVAQILAEA